MSAAGADSPTFPDLRPLPATPIERRLAELHFIAPVTEMHDLFVMHVVTIATWSPHASERTHFHAKKPKMETVMNKRAWTYVLLPLLLAAAGCTHTQLRWNTVQQSRTLTEIYEQQVLDNLAMFVTDPNSLPGFAYPNAGGSNVQDSASAGSMTNWVRNGGFSTQGLNLSGSRGMSESWTMTPIYDVRRLELMRCAYQQALVATGVYSNLSGCPNCEKLQRKFYTGNEDGSDDVATFTNKTGRTTPACLAPVCWFGHGERKCLPKTVCALRFLLQPILAHAEVKPGLRVRRFFRLHFLEQLRRVLVLTALIGELAQSLRQFDVIG
jgi:hypothetical protein